MSDSLSVIVNDSLDLERMLFEANGELTVEIEARMQEIATSLTTKVDALAFVLQSFDVRADQLKAREEEVKAMRKSFDKANDRLRSYIQMNIEALGTDSVEGNDYKFSIRENPGRLEIDDEALPNFYRIPTTTFIPDKERIKSLLLLGDTIQGCKLVKTKTIQMRMKGPRK